MSRYSINLIDLHEHFSLPAVSRSHHYRINSSRERHQRCSALGVICRKSIPLKIICGFEREGLSKLGESMW
jgi:hypothetical protein